MARACSSGIPLPPIGVGAPSPTLGPPWASPPPQFVSRWGEAYSGLGGCPPSPVSGRERILCTPTRGFSPPLLWAGVYFPPPSPRSCMPCAGSARCSGGAPLPPRPLAPRIFWACCGVAGVWPLCGPPPGGKLLIQSTMAWACSSGVPLPPNGVGVPSLTLDPLR